MDWSKIYLDTFIPELPKYFNENFSAFKRYLDIFFDENREIIIKPVETTGRVKGSMGEFVTCVVDNLVVKNQFTNLYQNTTTADIDFVNTYIGDNTSTRSAYDSSIFPLESSAFVWVDVNKPYIKIGNDSSYGFENNNIGQEFQIVFNTDTSNNGPYTILLQQQSSLTSTKKLVVEYDDASAGTWIKLISISYDPTWGHTWAVKQYGGKYTIL